MLIEVGTFEDYLAALPENRKEAVERLHQVIVEQLPAGFVPGHPIAGAEHTGVHAGKVDLFANHKVILTPLPSSADSSVPASV
jgi:3-phosphoshikimate 1-carboxyvinyltransferase